MTLTQWHTILLALLQPVYCFKVIVLKYVYLHFMEKLKNVCVKSGLITLNCYNANYKLRKYYIKYRNI